MASLGQTLIARYFFSGTMRSMNQDTPCTTEDQQAIVRAAEQRIGFLRWLCHQLKAERDSPVFRQEAAQAIEQLAGIKQ